MSELFSISKLSELFEMDRRTVKSRLADITPCGQKSGHPAFTIKKAAPALIIQNIAFGEAGSLNPDELPPDMRVQHYSAELKKRDMLLRDSELLEVGDVLETYSEVFKSIDDGFETLPDQMAVEFEWSAAELVKCQSYIDDWRTELYKKLMD
jgi:hypothetical protein